ncbi:MAG: hypothetical protein SGILL_001965, partial [Bacillariaceae sp.]
MSIYSMLYITKGMDKPPPNRNLRKISSSQSRLILQNIRNEFRKRYGSVSNDLLKQGLHAFGSIDHTAQRILAASREGRPLVMAFSGYSITVGRGNFFNQSFPFVVQGALAPAIELIFGIPLVVRNGAIGGIPSFPYGFCLEHFLGHDPDIISWDYSMNEGGKDSSVLEAFVRQATQQLPQRPMIIMLDTNAKRMKLLDEYTEKGWLKDALAVAKKEIVDEPKVLAMKPVPPGFQEWDQFGAVSSALKGVVGRGSWHPKKQEHALIGWLISMHFVEAMARAVEIQDNPTENVVLDSRQLATLPTLTKPISPKLPDNDHEVTELLFGHAQDLTDQGTKEYFMKDLSCRTSFLPATDNTKTLPSIIVSGFAEADLDIMIDRTDGHYKEGWVMDVSKVERDTKRKVEKCGGLGYIDMKIALYGVPDSGKLRLWLPFDGPSHDDHSHDQTDTNANHWFDDLIICEANEKRDTDACRLDRDLEIVVGGTPVTSIHPIKGAGEYLKRTTCVNVGVPVEAVVTKLGNVRSTEGRPLSTEEKKKFGGKDDSLGLVVDITAKSAVTRAKGA